MRLPTLFFALAPTLASVGCGDGGDDNVFLAETPVVIAHGGGQGLGPDHTLLSYGLSLDAGTDVLELDVHLSADGDVIVMHDDTVDRKTDGTGLIREMTTAEIQSLDAAYRWTPDGGETFPYRGMGITVPTADEVFEAYPDAWYVIEIKQVLPSMVDDLVALLDEHDLRDRALVASFNRLTIEAFREAAPDVLTSLSEDEGIELGLPLLLGSPLPEGYEVPASFFQVPRYFDVPGIGRREVLTEELIGQAAELGVIMHAWTINDPDEMDVLLSRGVRGLITDFPDRARDRVDAM
ncbi:MAG: glycerophosphodiester phosphodiesterase [Sandaracinaceae bacterium]